MRRKRPDPRTFDLTHPCPLCGYKIPPHELLHIDGEHIRCPKCGQESVYITKPLSAHFLTTVRYSLFP